MSSRIAGHLRSNVVGYVALFVALGGTTVAATGPLNGPAPGTDSVGSLDIINGQVQNPDIQDNSVGGSKVKNSSIASADVLDNSLTRADVNESSLNLAAEGWHEVGTPGEPVFSQGGGCVWRNFDNGVSHNSAAFLRDRHGFVHLKGMVRFTVLVLGGCDLDFASDRRIFTLPEGYRPAKREVLASISNLKIARISVDGPEAFGQFAGAVSVERPSSDDDAKQWVSLDGLSFRCAPSGSNGCP